jgi:hypothetical protein
MSGLTVSTTRTVNEQVERFPPLSVAVQVTVVVPSAKALPEGGTQATTGFGSVLSVTVGGG